jgi:ABC-type antimicrobial peptide transport system permease subunit
VSRFGTTCPLSKHDSAETSAIKQLRAQRFEVKVSPRAREIGIRMAPGANRHAVLGLVFCVADRKWRCLAWRGAMIAIGLARVAHAALAVMLLGLAVAAAYGPARRATALDPLGALRD